MPASSSARSPPIAPSVQGADEDSGLSRWTQSDSHNEGGEHNEEACIVARRRLGHSCHRLAHRRSGNPCADPRLLLRGRVTDAGSLPGYGRGLHGGHRARGVPVRSWHQLLRRWSSRPHGQGSRALWDQLVVQVPQQWSLYPVIARTFWSAEHAESREGTLSHRRPLPATRP